MKRKDASAFFGAKELYGIVSYTVLSGICLESLPEKPLLALPIFSILGSIDFSNDFVVLGDVGTGKSTVLPCTEFNLNPREIIVREPSRAACNALFYSLESLRPELKDELAVITKDTKINVSGKIKIVTDGVLLRMLAENSIRHSSIYFDESHQMTSQLELCMSLAKKNNESNDAKNLIRIMSATIDPEEFLSFLGIKNLYSVSGRRFPVNVELEMSKDLDQMFNTLSFYLYSQPQNESWLVFLPTRRLVEKYARSYGGTYIHGGLEGSEINKIQQRAELDKNLRIFATNVIASSVNIYVDNVLIFNEVIEGREKFGQKNLEYKTIDNNSLLQMVGRVGRFKPGRAVILSDTPVPKTISPVKVKKALENETPFDLVLLMAKYGLKLSELEFMSKVRESEIKFAEDWLSGIRAIERTTGKITEKGALMTEIPYEPDYSGMISEALLLQDYEVARFLLACGAFGDSLNHSYKSEMEATAKQFLFEFDKTSELNIKANLLKKYKEDREGRFISKLVANGIFPRFLDEAMRNYDAAIDSLNDVLSTSGREKVPEQVLCGVETHRLETYLSECLSFEKFSLYEKNDYDLSDYDIRGSFYARSLTMNYRKILFDVVALEKE
ncbi:MAG TPA: helicase-related protein [Nitrososphaerales archaeon]|nr:helicase-related protein [Nitrososphaerales archaeon]